MSAPIILSESDLFSERVYVTSTRLVVNIEFAQPSLLHDGGEDMDAQTAPLHDGGEDTDADTSELNVSNL